MLKSPRLLKILTSRQIKKIPLVVIAMFFGAGFEVLGLSLVIPLMEITTSQSESKIGALLENHYPELSKEYIIIFMLGIFSLFYVIKGIYLSFLAWATGRFTYGIKADINDRLMERYINGPYEFHLTNNSSQMIRNITTEATQIVIHALTPCLVIATEGILIVSIAIFLMILEPVGALVSISILFLCSLIFQKFIKNLMLKLGSARQFADGLMVQKAQESLSGIKDVKILSKEFVFSNQFSKYNKMSANASAQQFVWAQIPRMYLETIGVIVLSVLLLVLTIGSEDPFQTIPKLGVFALAAFKLLPSANRILSALNSLKFSDTVIRNLDEQLNSSSLIDVYDNKKEENISSLSFNDSIEIKNLYYKYPKTEKLTLDNISFSIKMGESVGIIGKSGAGKSTLADILLGLLTPTSGSILVDNVIIHNSISNWQQLIGYVQQDIFLLDDDIQKNIAFGLHEDEIDIDRMYQVINEAQLNEFVSSLPEGLHTQLGERGVRLSGGQKQRIGIARALYRKSSILVFDEATSSLDGQTESEIVSAINNLKGFRTIIVIAHRLSTIEFCDRIIELDNGAISKIFEDTEKDTLLKKQNKGI